MSYRNPLWIGGAIAVLVGVSLLGATSVHSADDGSVTIAGHHCLEETLDTSDWKLMCKDEEQQLALLCDSEDEMRCACVDGAGYHWTYGEVCKQAKLWCIGDPCPADE